MSHCNAVVSIRTSSEAENCRGVSAQKRGINYAISYQISRSRLTWDVAQSYFITADCSEDLLLRKIELQCFFERFSFVSLCLLAIQMHPEELKVISMSPLVIRERPSTG